MDANNRKRVILVGLVFLTVVAAPFIYRYRQSAHVENLVNKVEAFYQNGQYAECLSPSLELLKIREHNFNSILPIEGKVGTYLKNLCNVAFLYSEIGESEKAEIYFRKVIGILVDYPNFKEDRYSAVVGLGFLHYEKGEYHDAITIYSNSLDYIKTNFGDSSYQHVRILGLLAGSYGMLGEHTKAKSLYEESMQIIKNTENLDINYAYRLKGYAKYLMAAKDYDNAILYYEESIMIALKEKSKSASQLIKSNDWDRTLCYEYLGDYQSALKNFKRIESFWDKPSNEKKVVFGELYYHLSEVYFHLEDFMNAKKYIVLCNEKLDEMGEDTPLIFRKRYIDANKLKIEIEEAIAQRISE